MSWRILLEVNLSTPRPDSSTALRTSGLGLPSTRDFGVSSVERSGRGCTAEWVNGEEGCEGLQIHEPHP